MKAWFQLKTPVNGQPPGPGPTPIPCSVSENGPFENSLRSNSIFLYSKFHGLLKLIFHSNQHNGAKQQ